MNLVAGVDEAGRGCWAGPVYAAAAILVAPIEGLRDSKRLSASQREALAPVIRQRAAAWAVASASVEEIERLNILRASLLAMQRAVQALRPRPDECRVDGLQVPVLDCPATAIVGGDGLHPGIMAASILAKVERDAAMVRSDSEFPGYGFAQHKGYGTAEHRRRLLALGVCALHRRTFAPVAGMLSR